MLYLLIAVTTALAYPGFRTVRSIVRMIRGGREVVRSVWQGWVIRFKWNRLAAILGLTATDKKAKLRDLVTSRKVKHGEVKGRTLIPKLRITPDEYGVVVNAKTVPGVGVEEWQKVAHHLADSWGCVRVSVQHPAPGKVKVRGVRRDPLTTPFNLAFDPNAVQKSLDYVEMGVDEYAEPVRMRLKQASGFSLFGIPGSGKTSFVSTVFVRLATNDAVQFMVSDGKVTQCAEGDYMDLVPRLAAHTGDDLTDFNELAKKLDALRLWRSSNVRKVTGQKSIWETESGPTREWPLIIWVIDEAQTFLNAPKGDSKEAKAKQALVAENVAICENLIKKSRSVAIELVLATQKGTVDAIPSPIRDNVTGSACFAVRTSAAVTAALGDGIAKDYPDANPVDLQGTEYIGVCSTVVEGRKGLGRLRCPYSDTDTLAEVGRATAHLANAYVFDQHPTNITPINTIAAASPIDLNGEGMAA